MLSIEKMKLFFTQALALCLLCCFVYGVFVEDAMPGSEVFALLFLVVSAHVGGKLLSIIRLPPLVGMLVVGILFRNLPFIPYYENISVRSATTLRGFALVVILLRAGLGLDAAKLRSLSCSVLQLAFTPCLVEAAVCTFAAHFILGLPWTWAAMLGFVVSAVSPAVLVPGLLSLQDRCLGTEKGIPTLVIAASSIDDVIAITGFTIMLSMAFSQGTNIALTLLKGILEPVVGLFCGIFLGRIFWILPSSEQASRSIYRVVLLLCAGGGALFMSGAVGATGVGPMACLVLAFVAALRWKNDTQSFNSVDDAIDVAWQLLQPFLFSLIGAEVSLENVQSDLGSTVAVLAIGLVFRILTASLATLGGELNLKEKMFIAFAWLPKATVQAAIGPQALDHVMRNNTGPESEVFATKVLTAAVLSIVLTAPLGAFLIAVLGPLLLSKDSPPVSDRRAAICETEGHELF